MAYSKRDHLIINDSTTCKAALRQNSLTACLYFFQNKRHIRLIFLISVLFNLLLHL